MVSGEGQGLWRKRIVRAGILLVGSYAIMRHMAQKCIEPECIDQENPYISLGNNNRRDYREQKDDRQGQNIREAVPVYEGRIKPFLDRLLSFMALVLLAPVFAVIALAVYVDDPGPVFFTQTRVGKNKKFFYLHKFRSMKVSTPHDIPTHQLENPEQYITKVGRVLRKTSLDGCVIIGQTTESLENKGFREVSPIHFHRGHDLFSNIADHANIEGILCQSA